MLGIVNAWCQALCVPNALVCIDADGVLHQRLYSQLVRHLQCPASQPFCIWLQDWLTVGGPEVH